MSFNTALILTENFTIATNTCPTVTNINPTSGNSGASVTVTGTNFTGVSAVKFTNNVTAQFTVVSATQVTVIVPSGAASGPITISKPNCADVQTPSFTFVPQPMIGVSPASLDFGSVSAGQTKDLQITVNNTGNAALTVTSITNSNARFSVIAPSAPFNVAAGGQQAVTVRFAPNARGTQTGLLSLNNNDPSRARVDVSLSGNGLAPVIDVTPASLAFGNVNVGQIKDLQLTVRNTGDAALAVSSITSSNAQFNVTSPLGAFNVAAGASTIVNVRFAPNSAGAKTSMLSLNNNDPSRARVDVALTGTGVAPMIEVTPASLSFGNVNTGESLILRLTVRNTGNATLNVFSISSSDPQFTISLLSTAFALPTGSSLNINVRFAPVSAGAKAATLSFNSNDPISPRVDVAMTGTGLVPVIDVSPLALSFGTVKLALTRDLVLTIRNTGAAPLRVSSITSSNSQFSVVQFIERPSNTLRNLPLSIAPNNSVEVTVRFRPSFVEASVGSLTGTLSINSNDQNRPRVDVALTGTGLGALIAAPSELSFGGLTVCLAVPNTATLTLTNTGNVTLAVAAISIDNPAFALTPRPAQPFGIEPGASVTFGLSFYTRTIGTQTGRLVIGSNAVNKPGMVVILSGVGIAIPSPSIGSIVVSRITMSHGRADNARPLSPFNPFGLASVIGFAFPGGPLPLNSIAPGVFPPALIGGFPGLPAAAIASAPDPLHITLARLTGAIQGRITNAATNQPINGANVELLPFPLTFGTSDAGGNYLMADVPTGQQVILATAQGFYAKLAVVNVVADQTSTQNFVLTPQVGTVTGVVFDNFSQPVIGATVAVAGTNITASTDADGRYTLANVQAGTQNLNVSATGLRSAQATVNVVANETIYKDIYLQTPTGTVRGSVRNKDNNQPIAGASILVGIPFGVVYYSAFTDAGGNYTLNDIPAGTLTIYAGGEGFIAAQATTTIVANQTTIQDFLLAPDAPTTGTITGLVTNSINNQPVSGATITVAGTNISTTSGGDGSYTLGNVPTGAQTLNASRTGFRSATVQTTVTGGQTVTANITLNPGAGTITGTVRNAANGQPLSGATITVAGTNLSTTSGADGSFTLSNVPAGAQTLNASATGFIATQVQVTVTDNQSVTQNLSLSPTLAQGEIRITLNWSKDGDGHPDDLDMHLIGPNPDGSCFHVFYSNLGNLASAPFAQLEVDNIKIFGHPPTETIRIAKLTPGIYRFYVQDFKGEKPDGMSRSRATVQIFGSGGQSGNFTVPSGAGNFWTVFEINGQTGAITPINQLVTPAGNCR